MKVSGFHSNLEGSVFAPCKEDRHRYYAGKLDNRTTDSLDGSDAGRVLVAGDAAHETLCRHYIIQPDNWVRGSHHQIVSSGVE